MHNGICADQTKAWQMIKEFDPAAAALSAIQNASTKPVISADLRTMLATGAGEPSHLAALFSDVSLSILIRLAIQYEISDIALARAYLRARELHGASNRELDDFAAELKVGAPAIGAAQPI
jgi:hypothetical protein